MAGGGEEEQILLEALLAGDPPARKEVLDRACKGDLELRERIEKRLADLDPGKVPNAFLSSPAAEPSEKRTAAKRDERAKSSEDADKTNSVGPYVLGRKLGEGGFGTVYLAEQIEPIRREVALKVIKPGMDSAEIISRFESERQTLALMEHPNIAGVLDAGTTEEGRPYFVMELVRGEPITAYCDRQRLSISERLQLMLPVCLAVQHAHQKAVLHRDLKPSNILVTEIDGDPVPKVIDFGIAKALASSTEAMFEASLVQTVEGAVIGTPRYMSPEQAGATADLDTRSDIYMLGAILCELLTGDTPITRDVLRKAAFDEVLRMIRETEIPRPSSRMTPVTEVVQGHANVRRCDPRKLGHDLRGDLDWILLKALEKERERRYASAAALAEDVERYLNDEPIEASPPSAIYRFKKLVRRNRLAVGAAAGMLFLLAAGILASSWQAWRATTANREVTKRESRIADFLVDSGQNNVRNGGDPRRSMFAYYHALERCEPDSTTGRRARQLLAATAAQIGTIFVNDSPVISADWNDHEGKTIFAVAEGPVLGRWDAVTREALPLEKKPTDDFPPADNLIPKVIEGDEVIAFHPFAKRILTAPAGANQLNLRESVSRTTIAVLKHEDILDVAIYTDDGNHRRIAGAESIVEPLLEGKKLLGKPRRFKTEISPARFSPDGKHIVTSGRGVGRTPARIWDARDGTLIARTGLQGANTFAIHPGGDYLITADLDNHLRFWDLQEGGLLNESRPLADTVGNILFSPNMSRFLTNAREGSAQLWNAETREPAGPPIPGMPYDFVNCFSPDSRRVFIGTKENTIQAWDTKTRTFIGETPPQGESINCLFVSPDGSSLITGGKDGTVRVIPDPVAGDDLLDFEDEITAIVFNETADTIFTACEDNRFRLIEFNLEKRAASVTRAWKGNDPFGIVGSAMNRQGTRAAFGDVVGEGAIFDLAKRGGRVGELKQNQMMHAMAFSHDGTRVVTGDHGGEARMWDAMTGKAIDWAADHDYSVMAVGFSPDDTKVALAGGQQISPSRSLTLWDAETGEWIPQPTGIIHDGAVRDLVFSPDGKTILTCSQDRTARLWDTDSGSPIGRIMYHEGPVMDVDYDRNGDFLVTASEDGTARLWDASTCLPIGAPVRHSSPVTAVAFVPGKLAFVTGCKNGEVRLVRIAEPIPAMGLDILRLWIEVTTGLQEDQEGILHPLKQSEWQKRVIEWNDHEQARSPFSAN